MPISIQLRRRSSKTVSQLILAIGAGLSIAMEACLAGVPSGEPTAAPDVAYPFALPLVLEDKCEYCINPVVACRDVTVYESDSRQSSVAYKLGIGDTVAMRDGHLRVLRPDRVVFQTPWLDQRSGTQFLAGDTIYVFSYGREGSLGRWFSKGQFAESENSWMDALNLELAVSQDPSRKAMHLRDGDREWWMQVADDRGQIGWLPDDHRSVVYGNYYESASPTCGTPERAGGELRVLETGLVRPEGATSGAHVR